MQRDGGTVNIVWLGSDTPYHAENRDGVKLENSMIIYSYLTRTCKGNLTKYKGEIHLQILNLKE